MPNYQQINEDNDDIVDLSENGNDIERNFSIEDYAEKK